MQVVEASYYTGGGSTSSPGGVTGNLQYNNGGLFAGANFSTSDVEEKLDVGAGGKWVGDEDERSAYAQLLDIGGVALSGALPGYQEALGRAIPRMAAAFVF